MALSQAAFLARRLDGHLARKGRAADVVLRAVTRLAGRDPSPNPPRVTGALTVSGAHSAGAVTLKLAAPGLSGRVVAGDRFTVGAVTVQASAQAIDAGDDTLTVALAVPLPSPFAAGAAVAPVWAADVRKRAEMAPYPVRLVDNQLTFARDLRAVVSATGLLLPPQPQWRFIMPDGEERTTETVQAQLAGGEPVSYVLQVR